MNDFPARRGECLMGVTLAVALWASCACAADVVLLERATASGAVLRLGDIAAVLSADEDNVNRLSDAALTPAPASGGERTIGVQQVRDLLGAQGWDMSRVRMRGAQEVRVAGPPSAEAHDRGAQPRTPYQAKQSSSPHTGFRVASTARVKRRDSTTVRLSRRRAEELTAELTEKLNEYVRGVTGDPKLHALDVDLQERNARQLAAAESEIKIETTTALSEGRQRFVIRFDTAEGPVKFPVFARVVAARAGVRVTRGVPRGALITAADVEEAPLPLDFRVGADATIAASVEEVVGMEAARRLEPGDVVTDANTLPPLLVERGEVVTVTAGGGGIRVRRQVEAMSAGRYGELIEVRPLDSRTPFRARVVGRRELAVLSAGTSAVESVANHVEPLRLR